MLSVIKINCVNKHCGNMVFKLNDISYNISFNFYNRNLHINDILESNSKLISFDNVTENIPTKHLKYLILKTLLAFTREENIKHRKERTEEYKNHQLHKTLKKIEPLLKGSIDITSLGKYILQKNINLFYIDEEKCCGNMVEFKYNIYLKDKHYLDEDYGGYEIYDVNNKICLKGVTKSIKNVITKINKNIDENVSIISNKYVEKRKIQDTLLKLNCIFDNNIEYSTRDKYKYLDMFDITFDDEFKLFQIGNINGYYDIDTVKNIVKTLKQPN